MPTFLEHPTTQFQIPFALRGSSEEDLTGPVVVNTFAQSGCIRVFPLDVAAYAQQGIIFVATADVTEADPLEGVRDVVSAIKEARPLPTTRNMDALIRRAAASRGTPTDIDAWAQKIANKTGKLND